MNTMVRFLNDLTGAPLDIPIGFFLYGQKNRVNLDFRELNPRRLNHRMVIEPTPMILLVNGLSDDRTVEIVNKISENETMMRNH